MTVDPAVVDLVAALAAKAAYWHARPSQTSVSFSWSDLQA